MPTVGVASTATEPGCEGQLVLHARTTRVFDRPVVEKLKSISATGGTSPAVHWNMVDRDGLPVSLEACVDDPGGVEQGEVLPAVSTIVWPFAVRRFRVTIPDTPPVVVVRVRLRVRESTGAGPTREYPGQVVDPATGAVSAVLDPAVAGIPIGINHAEFGFFDAADRLVFSNRFWLVVDPGLFGSACPGGPLSIGEIRLALRDNGPADHNLIDTVLFDDAEIALAMRHPVDYWNEQPPYTCSHTTADFPYRFNWLQATCSRLFAMLAQYYRDNQLAYSTAGGVSVDDMNKAREYEAKAKELWDEYKAWAMTSKAVNNVSSFFGIINSPYDYGYWNR